MSLGRHQLLNWLNTTLLTQYPNIQSLGDGIAYCQLFQMVHPGGINISRLNMKTKLPIDCMRNLKILQSALKSINIPLTVSIDKMANGRFQDNILFTQWIYTHVIKYGINQNYNPYQRRLQILQKQNKDINQINPHLIPNQIYYQQQNQIYQNQNIDYKQRIDDINNYMSNLQNDLKQKMQLNWRSMHMISRYIDQRNILHQILQQIQQLAIQSNDSPIRRQILKVLYLKPQGFKQ